jgi:hypothetical protein
MQREAACIHLCAARTSPRAPIQVETRTQLHAQEDRRMVMLWNFKSRGSMLFEEKTFPRLVCAGEQRHVRHERYRPTTFKDLDSSFGQRSHLRLPRSI